MRFKNLTGYEVVVYTDKAVISIRPSRNPASVSLTCSPVVELDVNGHKVPVVDCDYDDIKTPELKDDGDVVYIVSPEVADALERGKPHPVLQNSMVVVPITEGLESSEYGRFVYTRMFRIVRNNAYREWRLMNRAREL